MARNNGEPYLTLVINCILFGFYLTFSHFIGIKKHLSFDNLTSCRNKFISVLYLYEQNLVNPLSDYKILDWSKLKQIADDSLKRI